MHVSTSASESAGLPGWERSAGIIHPLITRAVLWCTQAEHEVEFRGGPTGHKINGKARV